MDNNKKGLDGRIKSLSASKGRRTGCRSARRGPSRRLLASCKCPFPFAGEEAPAPPPLPPLPPPSPPPLCPRLPLSSALRAPIPTSILTSRHLTSPHLAVAGLSRTILFPRGSLPLAARAVQCSRTVPPPLPVAASHLSTPAPPPLSSLLNFTPILLHPPQTHHNTSPLRIASTSAELALSR